ncbi:hypothetical protein PR048_032803 [Dryococelus australis]|uniref:Uncharacterized protein n=1 Tax=Dryococelus australis TaxID=614101 RepID=A0ABQ9G7F2_9NEOP|nr:hypothetical protein PR048_032803 [Dryococelus australis]
MKRKACLQDGEGRNRGLRDFKKWQEGDEDCGKITQAIFEGRATKYIVENGIIYMRNNWNEKQVFVPKKARNLVLKYFHDSPREGH